MSKTEQIQNLAKELGLSYSEAEIIINDLEPEQSESKKIKVKRKKKSQEIPQQEEIKKESQPKELIRISNQLSSEDILKIMNISNPNILNLFFKVLLEETIKRENNQQHCTEIDYCIGLANDKYHDKFKKIQEIKEQLKEKEVQEEVQEVMDIDTLRKMRSQFFSQ